MRAISHAMVTVDEDIPTSQGYEFVPSADLVAFEDLGGVKIAEYSAPLSRIHQGATEYRRALIFCDVDEETSYTLDLFLVAGGRIHDYAMNGPRFFEGDSGSYLLEGVSPEARAGVWTLAALGTMDGSEEANAPGKSWGERIGPNDRIQGRGRSGRKPVAIRMAVAPRKRVCVRPRREDRRAGTRYVRTVALRRRAGYPFRCLVTR